MKPWWVLIAGGLCGCAEEAQSLVRIRVQEDHLEQREEPRLDILWVIDNSHTMGAEQSKILEQASLFLSKLLPRRVDFHVGVVTTDPSEQGHLVAYRGPAVEGCDGCRFLSRAVPCADPRAPEGEYLTRCPALAVFRGLTGVGTEGSAAERAFDSAAQALGLDLGDPVTGVPPIDPGSGRVILAPPVENEGFLRDEADLLLIFVSDEDEGLKRVGAPVRYYERIFSAVKARTARRVMVSSLTGWPYPDQGAAAELPGVEGVCGRLGPLWDGDPINDGALAAELQAWIQGANGCLDRRDPQADLAYAEVGHRFVELTCRLGGIIGNLCAEDYQAPFAALTEAALGLGRSFVPRFAADLDRGPDCRPFTADDPRVDCDEDGNTEGGSDGPICVRATPENGDEQLVPQDRGTGWEWDDAAKAVVFQGAFVPSPGTEVVVRYRVAPQQGACR